jgi:hydrogenase large subunit
MPATSIVIDPVTRLEGHLKITVQVDTVGGVQQVTDARATGTLVRGFESILINRPPEDAEHLTQRICGVCPVSHGLAAVLAQDAAGGVTVPDNARIMRNLVLGSNFIQSHILHFYHLALQDFVGPPPSTLNMAPWTPNWVTDKRLGASVNTTLWNNYAAALTARRQAHEMGALFGGRLPHPPTYLSGGFTTTPRAARITAFKNYLSQLITFINNTYLPDIERLAQAYSDYDHTSAKPVGRGYGNLLAYGVFDLNAAGTSKLLKRGRVVNGSTSVQTVSTNSITEQVTYSWYADSTNNLNPASGAFTPQYPKGSAYSWLKAPRYSNSPYEVGPLARMWVNGDYRLGISVMDRHRARAREALKVAQAMQTWVGQITTTGPVYTPHGVPASASGIGLTEAPRGALGHWLQISNSKISRYQVVTPTCWNASPRDSSGNRGPIEQALIGTPVKNTAEPVEVLRVIHSFDPCLSCAVHVMRPGKKAKVFTLNHVHGEEMAHPRHHHPHGHGHSHGHGHGR